MGLKEFDPRHYGFPPSNITIDKKYLKAKKIKDLGEQLREECIKNSLSQIGGFTIMFDSENGRTIRYVRDMPTEQTGGMKDFYDRDSASFRHEYAYIDWPYTGFVQGNLAGWMPISEVGIVIWLEGSHYNVDDFIEKFKP